MKIKETSTREQAIAWWNGLNQETQIDLQYKYKSPSRHPLNVIGLTGREIEQIWLKENKLRFEIIKTVLSDFVLFAIVDNEMNKVVCHMVYDNGEQYCDEMANKIVSVLNMDLPSINETLKKLGVDYSEESKFNQTKIL